VADSNVETAESGITLFSFTGRLAYMAFHNNYPEVFSSRPTTY